MNLLVSVPSFLGTHGHKYLFAINVMCWAAQYTIDRFSINILNKSKSFGFSRNVISRDVEALEGPVGGKVISEALYQGHRGISIFDHDTLLPIYIYV